MNLMIEVGYEKVLVVMNNNVVVSTARLERGYQDKRYRVKSNEEGPEVLIIPDSMLEFESERESDLSEQLTNSQSKVYKLQQELKELSDKLSAITNVVEDV